MDVVFGIENVFYLTGGTCLSRFYQAKRYSEDLDFFAMNEPRFNAGLKNIKIALKKIFQVNENVSSKDFVRLIVDDYLQVDFINDRVLRYGESIILDNGYHIDNVENILSNKLNAIIDRDDEKDIFDLYLIWKYYNFDWNEILNTAHGKSVFAHEDLIIRLKSFPVKLLDNINIIDQKFLSNFKQEFNIIIEEINTRTKHKGLGKK